MKCLKPHNQIKCFVISTNNNSRCTGDLFIVGPAINYYKIGATYVYEAQEIIVVIGFGFRLKLESVDS